MKSEKQIKKIIKKKEKWDLYLFNFCIYVILFLKELYFK